MATPAQRRALRNLQVPTGMISNWPSGADSDQDGTADAWEIQMYGDVNVYPCGSVFKIR